MKSVLIIGMGRFGRHCAMKLNELGHEVMTVDRHEERVNDSLSFSTNALIGDSTNYAFMESLGVSDFDLCIVAIGDDFQSSLETTALLQELGAKYVVARACRDVQAKFLLRNGANEVVYPERELAEWCAIRYSSDYILDYIAIDKKHAIFEIAVPKKWIGKTLSQLDARRKYQINVVAIKEGDELITNVDPDLPLTEEHTLMVIGENGAVDRIR